MTAPGTNQLGFGANLPNSLYSCFLCGLRQYSQVWPRRLGPWGIAARRTCGGSPRLRAVYKILQFFAGLEEGDLLRRNFDLCAGFWIAADAPAALPRAETSESANLDFFALLQGFDNAFKNSFDDGLGLLARQFRDAQNLLDEVGLRQCRLLGHRRYASLHSPS